MVDDWQRWGEKAARYPSFQQTNDPDNPVAKDGKKTRALNYGV